jgi:diketogulonate reductase-like aldo/keto reductase
MYKYALNNGLNIPCIGMGSNRMNQVALNNTASIFVDVLGFYSIDTSRNYQTEPLVGNTIKMLLKGKLSRDNIFVTTKIEIASQVNGKIEESINSSLKNLKLDYIDLVLIHWPLPRYYIETYRKLVYMQSTGKIKSVGLCNCRERHLRKLIDTDIGVMPVINQIECHPLRNGLKIREFCDIYAIVIEAYSPLCKMISPIKENGVLNDLSRKYHKTIPQIILRWHIQNGIIPIFKSITPKHVQENINIFDFELDTEEMTLIDTLNIDYHFFPESVCCPAY